MTIQITASQFSNRRVLVLGDVMLDRYWLGDAFRISPEAPVPVINVSETENRAGGAANVAQNIAALGAQVSLFGWVGEDNEASLLKQCLHENITPYFFSEKSFHTITKLRVIGRQQQLIRMDFEKLKEPLFDDHELFSEFVRQLDHADAVVLSDYSKGALTHIEKFIAAVSQEKIPLFIDPKNKDYERYAGATVLTPNLKEFESVVGVCADLPDVIARAKKLLEKIYTQYFLITLGKDGMVLVSRDAPPKHFSARARDVFDVTGAGDTVISVLAASVASNMNMQDAVELANTAAGIVVQRLGAATVSVADLQHALNNALSFHAPIVNETQLTQLVRDAKKRGEKIVMTNGCFDILHIGHADYLAKARAMGDRLIVAVNDDASVRQLKGDDRPINSIAARMQLLSALRAVDWVISFSENTPERLIENVMPDILVKGGDYQVHEIAGSDAVLKNGGEVRIVSLVPGFSTTALIRSAGMCASTACAKVGVLT